MRAFWYYSGWREEAGTAFGIWCRPWAMLEPNQEFGKSVLRLSQTELRSVPHDLEEPGLQSFCCIDWCHREFLVCNYW